MRRVRQGAQGLVSGEQPAPWWQGASHALSQANDELGLRKVQGDDLHHFFIAQYDSGRQGAVSVDAELAPLTEEVGHFAITRNVANCEHSAQRSLSCTAGAHSRCRGYVGDPSCPCLCSCHTSGVYVTVRRPILRTWLSQSRLIRNTASRMALQRVVQNWLATMGSNWCIEPASGTPFAPLRTDIHLSSKGDNMDRQDNAPVEWQGQVKHGALQTFAYYRRLLKAQGELTSDARQGLIDIIDFTEDHMMAMWEIIDEGERHERMTQRASDKI